MHPFIEEYTRPGHLCYICRNFQYLMFRACLYTLFIFYIIFIVSCSNTKRVVFFAEDARRDSIVYSQDIAQHGDAIIYPDDILAINVASTTFANEMKPSQVFLDGGLSFNSSATIGPGSGAGGTSGKNSYLVDSAGFIDYPIIGKIHMGGLSIRDAKDLLLRNLVDYLKQPVVEVRIVNYRITMLGEIGTQGPIIVPNHKITIIDAIAAAGGIPLTGRKDNILIIREAGGRREFGHINLNNRSVFNSPYYYLRQNDIVYVEPSHIRRQEANEFLRLYLPLISGLLSSALAIFAIIQYRN